MSRSDLRSWLARHPRATTALFTVALLLTQVQTAAAEAGILDTGASPGGP